MTQAHWREISRGLNLLSCWKQKQTNKNIQGKIKMIELFPLSCCILPSHLVDEEVRLLTAFTF